MIPDRKTIVRVYDAHGRFLYQGVLRSRGTQNGKVKTMVGYPTQLADGRTIAEVCITWDDNAYAIIKFDSMEQAALWCDSRAAGRMRMVRLPDKPDEIRYTRRSST